MGFYVRRGRACRAGHPPPPLRTPQPPARLAQRLDSRSASGGLVERFPVAYQPGSGGDRQAAKGPAGTAQEGAPGTQPEQLRRRCGDDEWGGRGGGLCGIAMEEAGGGGGTRQ